MSYLLNSGLFGITDKDRNSIDHIYNRWKFTGFLDGLEYEVELKVSIAFEILVLLLLSEQKMCDMYYKMTGEIVDEEREFDVFIFPIVRRVISGFNEAHQHVPEILNMVKKEFNSILWRSIKEGRESAIVYFYDVILLNSGDEWHANRVHKTYHELKRHAYQRYLSRGGSNSRSYEEFEAIDTQAEFCAYLARKIENKLREKYEKIN